MFLIWPALVFSSRSNAVMTIGSAVPHQSGQKRRVPIIMSEYLTFSTLLREMTQFETIIFLKSPTPSVPIFIAAEVEISVQPVISMFSHGPYSELPFEVLRQMQSSAHSTWQSQIRTLLQWSGSMPSEFATSRSFNM